MRLDKNKEITKLKSVQISRHAGSLSSANCSRFLRGKTGWQGGEKGTWFTQSHKDCQVCLSRSSIHLPPAWGGSAGPVYMARIF